MDEKASKLGNGLSWDIWAVDGNWRTNPPPPPSSTSAPTTDQAHQNMTCLKLGKRQYQEEGRLGVKKDKVLMVGGGFSSSSTLAPVARCQVEGCNVSLKDAKEYYKKHKVCGVHSKSPRVIVLGVEQRFCQQCSRFHAVSEFDETKRSCRRRLAGHNERRKISGEAIMRSRSLDNTTMRSRYCYLPSTSPSPSPSLSPTSTSSGHVLSLLSGADFPWVSPVDGSNTSYQSSAALRELIAENRAVHLAQKLYMEEQQSLRSVSTPFIIPNIDNNTHRDWDSSWCNHLCDAAATNPHITLDLMQIACPSFEFLSKKNESGEEPNEDEEEEEDQDQCSEIWKSLEEKHLV